MNPHLIFEKRMAVLEGGVGALATASGSASITYAIQNIAKAGDHLVSASNLYGGTYNLFENTLKEQGLSVTFVNPSQLDDFEKRFKKILSDLR
jgi:O-acetylhomoserine (thiol)-lyase